MGKLKVNKKHKDKLYVLVEYSNAIVHDFQKFRVLPQLSVSFILRIH